MAKSTVIETIKHLENKLMHRYPDDTLRNQTAWWMLEAITKESKASLIAKSNLILSEQQEKALENWIYQQVNQHIPLQYLLGSVPFDDLEILVEPPILIPRPETEEWCMRIITALKKLPNQAFTILDLCSGSGCIALTFAKAFPSATVYALDISAHAIALGTKNAQHNNIENVRFIQSDLFSNLPAGIAFDLIITNPPYIPSEQWEALDLSVTKWEDPGALIADDHGLAIIKKIITQAPRFIQANAEMAQHAIPQFVIEIDTPQASTVAELMHQGGFTDIAVQKDLEGKERTVVGRLSNVAITKGEQ